MAGLIQFFLLLMVVSSFQVIIKTIRFRRRNYRFIYFQPLESINEPVKQVACGVWSSFVVMKSGRVLFWGQFRNIKRMSVWIPTEIEEMNNVSKISIGHKHILSLSDTGNISGFGCNKYGQIDFQFENVLDIYAGWNHSVIKLDTNTLLLGKNDHNQLAHHDKSIKRNLLKI